MRKLPPGSLAVAAMFLVALAFTGTGAYYLLVNERGTSARATVTDCKDHSEHRANGARTVTKCTGYWILGGPLGDGGHKVFGEVRGAGWGDLDETVGVRVYHGRAYVAGLTLSIGFFGLAGFFALAGVGLILTLRWLSRRSPAPQVTG